MPTFKHKTLIITAGMVWFAAGIFLLQLGLRLLTGLIAPDASFSSLFTSLSKTLGSYENSVVALIAIGLVIGFYKGRFVLAKSAKRVIARIRTFEEPTSIARMYSLPYYLLLLAMMGLGMAIKAFNVPMDIRGTVDVAIGAALINGSMLYFRQAR